MKGASDKSRSTNKTSGVLLAWTESATSPVHSGDNLPDDRQPRDIDIQPWSIVERLYRRLVEGQESADPPAKGLSSEPGRSSLDSRQADVTNTCRLLTPVRNQDNFNEVTDEDFELLSAENTLTEDEKDDPDSGRLKIELTDEEKEKEASG
ncbi:hypothetical protein KQX54_011729 [Cotesia glomerata]|uniref:Uncharacterized protein n=1 Tax=Cotesia glomerata TaxID=32391 RepID=A0AAV7IA74_COTGL|nr:hypothetical protein KQX54_011722 [Cotesia glomerata]KAH0549652.1 hypothetical protein KQX54_011729 [Cotesia glomerata]